MITCQASHIDPVQMFMDCIQYQPSSWFALFLFFIENRVSFPGRQTPAALGYGKWETEPHDITGGVILPSYNVLRTWQW